MKLLLLALLLVCCPGTGCAADWIAYYHAITKAAQHHRDGANDSAYAWYGRAFALVDSPHAADLKAAAKIAAKLGHKEEREKMRSLAARLEQPSDAEYGKLIDSLSREDQRVRDKQHEKALGYYYTCLKRPGCDTGAAEFRRAASLRGDMHRTDSLVIAAMLQLIRSRGFPAARRVGSEAAVAAFVILLHYDKDTDNSILKPYLDSALYAGELSPENYALIADRRASWVRREEPYYYQLPTRPGQPFPAGRSEEINRRRAAIGLPPFGSGSRHPF